MNETNFLSYAKLQLHINTPSIEETWLDGFECAQLDIDITGNPYPQGSTEHFHWEEGWWSGFYKEEPLFNLEGEAFQNTSIPVEKEKVEFVKSVSSIKKIAKNSSYTLRWWHIISGILSYLVVYELLAIIA